MGCWAMVGDYSEDSSGKENLNLLLRLARVETSVNSRNVKGIWVLEGLLQVARMLGASAASHGNIGCLRGFQGFVRRSAHSKVVRGLREIQED